MGQIVNILQLSLALDKLQSMELSYILLLSHNNSIGGRVFDAKGVYIRVFIAFEIPKARAVAGQERAKFHKYSHPNPQTYILSTSIHF